MTKSSDVRWGRRGGRTVPTGVEPGKALDDLEAIRAAAKQDGSWPDVADEAPAECEGQLGLFDA